MRFAPVIIAALLLLVSGGARQDPLTPAAPELRRCTACHQGIAVAEPVRDGPRFRNCGEFGCSGCHLNDSLRGVIPADAPDGHPRIQSTPSPLHTAKNCRNCHPAQAMAVANSRHSTLSGVINQTRYLWGAQRSPANGPYVAGGSGRLLPPSGQRPRTTAMLVNDFLHANCLRCHLDQPDTATTPPRPAGCAACHGNHGSNPPDTRQTGLSAPHPPFGPVSEERCLACHNGDHTGGDYAGLFPRDSHPMFQDATTWGRPVPHAYGGAQHLLARDVHAGQGLECPDCHQGRQVMGLPRATVRSCEACHGHRNGRAPDTNVPGVMLKQGKYLFRTRNGGTLCLPQLQPGTPGHDPALHGRVGCSACHSQWTFGAFGLSASRLDSPSSTTDRRPGQWVLAWRFRRWEHLILGVDSQDRITALRPRHQYLVSYGDRLGRTVLDSVVPQRGDGSAPGWAFEPYTPHTVGARGRLCGDCHENALAVGSGPEWAVATDFQLLRAAPPTVPGARLLNPGERNRLLTPGRNYQTLRAQFLNRLLAAQEGGG